MFNNTSSKDLWSETSSEVVKVIIKETGAERLPNEILQREMMNRSIILDDNDLNINISIIESKRKRYVYAMKLKYEHRQTVNILYEGIIRSLIELTFKRPK